MGDPVSLLWGGPGSTAAKSRINHEAVVLCRPSLSSLSLSLFLSGTQPADQFYICSLCVSVCCILY